MDSLYKQKTKQVTSATNTVVKNYHYLHTGTMKYTYKMDDADNGPKYQAEGYAFWKVIEACVDYTDACYNNKTHTMSYIGAGQASDCDGFQWYEDLQCTMVAHLLVTTNGPIQWQTWQEPTGAEMNETNCNDGFGAVFIWMPMYYDNYGAGQINDIVNLQDATKLGTSYDIAPYLQMVLSHYGITAAELGTYA